MDGKQKQSTIQAMERILQQAGAKPAMVQSDAVLEHDGEYYRISFGSGLGFIVEWAGSFEEAQKNRYENIEVYPHDWSEEKILEAFRSELKTHSIL